MMRSHVFVACAAIAAAGGAACAQSFTGLPAGTDVDALFASFAFTAEGRIGDRGGAATFELDIGVSTAAPADTAQFDWVNGGAESFTLSWDGTTASFSLGGETVSFDNPGAGLDLIVVRAFAQREGSSVLLGDLMFGGASAPIVNAVGAGGLDLLRVDGIGSPLVVTGAATLGWNPADLPRNSQLAFQIKAGTVIPSPAGVTVLVASGIFAARRRR